MFINRAKSAHAAGQVKPLSLSQLERYQALFLPLALSAFAWSSPKLECIVLLQLRLYHKFTFFAQAILSCGAKLIATWSNFDPHDKRNCHVEKNFPHDFFDPQIMSAASATNMMNEPHDHTLSGIPTNKSFKYRKSTKTIMSAHWLKDQDDY